MSDKDLPLHRLSAVELRERIASRLVSAEAVARHFLDRIEKHGRANGLNAFLSVDAEGALAAARACDERRAAGLDPRPLEGVPVALKDNIHAAGQPTTCASRILAGFRAPHDATVTQRLRRAGAVVVGKTNLDEFAMGSSTENSAFGPTKNPWDPTRVPGGSSGGSAAAVAAGLVPLALGSETGGSVRQPASLCGLVGVKPTYGRVSRSGLVAFASSLDQVGPFARTVRDAATALHAIAGPDPMDATTLTADPPSPEAAALAVRGLRVGVVREHLEGPGIEPGVRKAVEAAVKRLEEAGAVLKEVSLPHSEDGIAVYYLMATGEASSNLARFDGVRYGLRADAEDLASMYERTRDEGFGTEVKRRILLGTFALSAGHADDYFLRALKVRRLIARDYDRAFREVDALVGPTSPTVAFPLGAKARDPVAMYLCDTYAVPANLAGVPAVSVPCGRDAAGLPVGLQVQAAAMREDTALRVAAAVEAASGELGRFPEAYA